jgi:catechol 2,3-dioxygenase-like lactoylglutathione lyase family enzyme
MRRSIVVMPLLAVLGMATTPSEIKAQVAPLLKDAPLTHLVVVTPDIAKTSRGYGDIFGIETPVASAIEYELPNGKKETATVAYVPMPNFYIAIVQPTGQGPMADHLKQFGLGLWALGVAKDSGIDAVRAELESKGGKWTGGSKGGAYAWVDFRATPIGATIIVGPSTKPSMPEAPAEQTGLFGGLKINHVGFANTDAEASVNKLVEVFGFKKVAPRRFPTDGPFPYPPDMWTENGSVQTAMMFQGKVGVEVIQGVGEPNPWSAHIAKQKGISLMHIAVGRGKLGRAEWLKMGQDKGGTWTNGGPPPEGSFAYLDWTETLGIVIE